MSIETLKKEMGKIKDPRRTRYGNIRHKLEDILIIGLCSTVCMGVDFIDMEDFGKEHEEFLRGFLELPNGIPTSDTFRRVFERVNPSELSACLRNWLAVERDRRCVLSVDGKRICGSENEEHDAYHVVSAFVAENQITLGEITVENKSNEIPAFRELLDLIDVEGAIVTSDAMGCQRETVGKIVEKKADYAICLKGNQSTLLRDVKEYMDEFSSQLPSVPTLDKDHGRIEERTYRLETDVSWLEQKDDWPGLRALGMVSSRVTIGDEISECTRYFITSLTDVDEFAYAVRKHWSVENQLHWCLDVIFREDASRARKDNSPLNLNVLQKIALYLISKAQPKRVSKKRMMRRATMDHDILLNIMFPA